MKGEALISYLGIGNLSLIDYSKAPLPLHSEDVIVLMSDGVYRLLPDEEIKRVIMNFNDADEALRVLEMKAKNVARINKSVRDNATLAVVTII